MKLVALSLFYLFILGCKNGTINQSESVELSSQIEPKEKENKSPKLIAFLEHPIHLKAFKEKKKKGVTTSVSNGSGYYLKPNISDSIFYVYNYLSAKINPREVNQIVVLKYGANKNYYEDENEILIELKITSEDIDLEKANLIGLTKTELESEFGTDHMTFYNRIVYSNSNKVLIVEFEDSKVKSFRYVKLNSTNISEDLINQILA